MGAFEIAVASAADVRLMGEWAAEEGWNPGDDDAIAFSCADPHGFLIGRVGGEPAVCISVVRYGAGFGFLGFYIAHGSFRGHGYGMRIWRAGMARLAGCIVGLDGVVAQQDNYRASGFTTAWNTIRFEGVPAAAGRAAGVALLDARSLPFDLLAAYDRRFFPAARDGFLACWLALPGRKAVAAVRDGEILGFGVIRPCRAASRVGPLYAASSAVAGALVGSLASAVPGRPVVVDVPDVNPASVGLMEQLGLTPVFETARMYAGPVPPVDRAGLFGLTSLELG